MVEPSGNGHGRRGAVMDLQPRRHRRRWPLVAAVLALVVVMGARKCKVQPAVSAAQQARARIDVRIGCWINDCTEEQLQQLLRQVENYPVQER